MQCSPKYSQSSIGLVIADVAMTAEKGGGEVVAGGGVGEGTREG